MKYRDLSIVLTTLMLFFAGPLAGQHMNGFELESLLIPRAEIRHGGPPREGIPAIDDPDFVRADDAGFLNDEDYVLGVAVEGIAKAYPVRVMNYHEIVNDHFGDRPVVITYCPLCGSGMAFDADIEDRPRTFGVSGLLYNSDVLLYDRQTESLWSQIMMKAVSGKASGTELKMLPTAYLTWGEWKERYPETLVLTPKTGHRRDYSRSPYEGYEESERLMFPVAKQSDRFPKKEKVIGVEIKGAYKAYPFSRLGKTSGRITDTFQGKTLRIDYNKKTETARITDAKGEDIPAVTLYWFAWFAFHPDTEVY